MADTCSTFVFMDGTLPLSRTQAGDPAKFKKAKNVEVVPSGEGVIVELHNTTDDPVYVKIPNTSNWLVTDPEQVDMFFNLMQ